MLELDREFARFLEKMRREDAIVLVCADHGFVDTEDATRIHLDDHPRLASTLRLPLCGEQRTPYCYVKPGEREVFEQYVSTELAGVCELVSSDTLVDEGFFGPGDPHRSLRDRIGDYALIMNDNYVLKDRIATEQPGFKHVGVHGGVSQAEMHVPLVVARTGGA